VSVLVCFQDKQTMHAMGYIMQYWEILLQFCWNDVKFFLLLFYELMEFHYSFSLNFVLVIKKRTSVGVWELVVIL